MPDTWLYAIGGVLIGMLVFTIGYQLLSVSINQIQYQNFVSDFTNFHTELQSVCLQELGTSLTMKLKVPYSVRVIYATDDTENPPLAVVDRIKNMEFSSGNNVCFQFKREQNIRCAELDCMARVPYMGALETYNDLQLKMNKILGRSLTKEYTFEIIKKTDSVEVSMAEFGLEGDQCSTDEPCSSEASYCWSETSSGFTCHINCAPVDSYSLNTYSCCSKNRDSTSGKCIDSATTTPDDPGPTSEDFTILFIKLNDGRYNTIDNFNTKAESILNNWYSTSPLSSTSCGGSVKKIVVDDRTCSVPSQSRICSGDEDALIQTEQNILNCVDQWGDELGFTGSYKRIVAMVPGTEICSLGELSANGYTIRATTTEWVVVAENPRDSSAGLVTTHELAHTFMLCDEGYGNFICGSCSNGICATDGSNCEADTSIGQTCPGCDCCPNRPEHNSIMCSNDHCGRGCSPSSQFAPTSYNHLKQELNSYCST